MKTRKSFLPGTMSFCLPGLGNLYLGQIPRAAVHFCLFVVFLALPVLRGFVPLCALVAAGDAYWITPGELPPSLKSRTMVFLVVGLMGFLSWFGLVGTVNSPFARQTQINRDVLALAKKIQDCKKTLTAYPTNLLSCGITEIDKDPWGSEYLYLTNGLQFELRSAGPDRTPSTADDFVYPFR